MLKTTRVRVSTWGRTPFQNAVFKLSLKTLSPDTDIEIRSALLTSAVVSYGRPFSSNIFKNVWN